MIAGLAGLLASLRSTFVTTLGELVGGSRAGTYSSQLCLSNKELRKEMLKLLKENIRKGRKEAAAWGVTPPQLYDVSQNDNGEKCTCSDCQAIVKKYGAESGLMLGQG